MCWCAVRIAAANLLTAGCNFRCSGGHVGMCGWARRLEDGRGGRTEGHRATKIAFGSFALSRRPHSSSRGSTEVEDGSEKPGSSQGCSRHVKAAGLGQEVGGITLVTARFGGIKGCLQTASAVGGFSDPPAVAGKGSPLVGPEQRQNCRERLYGRGTNCLGCPTRRFGAGCGKSLAHVLS